MRLFAFFLSLGLTLALVYALSIQLSTDGRKLPPLGAFLSPSEGFWQNAESVDVDMNKGDVLQIPGLSDKVNVNYDAHNIPHIFAKNRLDAIRVQGYLTAKNRLWQMDITTRKMSGRLAEVLGDNLIKIDRLTRRRGLVWAAENDVEGWEKHPEELALLEAYTEGINAFITALKPADYPLEFKLLHYKPEPWSILKTAFVIESMAESLCFRADDVEATTTRKLIGERDFNLLFPTWNPKNPPIVADNGQWNAIHREDILPNSERDDISSIPISKDAESGDISLLGHGELSVWEQPNLVSSTVDEDYKIGSNNWALSGLKTASGQTLLANDPHLKLTLPSIWYQLQINTPEGNVSGVSLPGLPGIIIGFNEDIAWGVTNVGHDVVDWYKIDWVDSTRTSYRYGDAIKNVEFRTEKIRVAGSDTLIVDTVRYTVWGPVVYDDYKHPKGDLALHWLASEVPIGNEISVFETMNTAKVFADYTAATKEYNAPAQNMVFASKKGDIAIRITGKLPIKHPNQGRFVQDGSDPNAAWQGYIPFMNMPFWKNPSRGFVFSANQHSTPPSYPYAYNGGFDDSRARRIYKRLSDMSEATMDSMKSIQLDCYNSLSADGLAAMLKLLKTEKMTEFDLFYFKKMKEWNAQYLRTDDAPSFYEIWSKEVYKQTFDEFYDMAETRDIIFPETWVINSLLANNATNKWFDKQSTTDKSETAHTIVQNAFGYAVEEAERLKTTNSLYWGKYKGFQVQHLGRIPAFGRFDLETDGDRQSPNAIGAIHGPSWRMIVDLDGEVKAQAIYPGGQSGNPGSPYYDDMLEDWVAGNYYTVEIMKEPTAGSQIFVSK